MSNPARGGDDQRVLVSVPVTDDQRNLDDVADQLRQMGVDVERKRGWETGATRSILCRMNSGDVDNIHQKVSGIGKPIRENVYRLPPTGTGPAGPDLA